MAQFVTISPTHVRGQKRNTWERFKEGGYIAIGWLPDLNLQGWTDAMIAAELESREEPSWVDGQHDLPRFVNKLRVGDIVAVTNSNSSILGIGKITSDYYFEQNAHETGDEADRYPHFRSVRWLSDKEWFREDLILPGEVSWEPRGTLGKIAESVPAYIWRALDTEVSQHLQEKEQLLEQCGDYSSNSGQGFQLIPERRRSVENFAMESATRHYESLGYKVVVVGKPYDLRCISKEGELFVEVKGTETHGDFILLTKNEVNLARKRRMELFLVSEIRSEQTLENTWQCSGGTTRIIQPWKANEEQLEAYAFIYRID